jgi:predicted RNA binding protein YcfA (HicA-like mRNA interferase family)
MPANKTKRVVTASVWKEGDWFVAQALDADVASQGESLEDALGNLARHWSFTSSRPFRRPGPSFAASKWTSPPIRPLPNREVARRLAAAGFAAAGQKGSHVKFVKATDESVLTAIVPRHREVAVGTLRSILRQARLTPGEFERL